MIDAKQLLAAQAAKYDVDRNLRAAQVQDELRKYAAQLRQFGKDAFDEGYPDRKLIWQEATAGVLRLATVIRTLDDARPIPNTQASLNLEEML